MTPGGAAPDGRTPSDRVLTFFSIPKGFEGHIGIIQTNAIRSWSVLPGCDTVLFGEENGLAEAARSVGARHVPTIARNERGTPMVSDAFDRIREVGVAPAICYANSDIMFTAGVARAARFLSDAGPREWLVVGRRHDLDVTDLLSFTEGWEERLLEDVGRRGQAHGSSGIDYFLFPRSLSITFPPLAVGRPGWDNWLIFSARTLGIPVIDGSEAIACVHQNHPARYRSYGTEARRNTNAAGGYFNMATLRDADWRLEATPTLGLRLVRRPIGNLMFSPPVRGILALRRYIAEHLSRLAG